MQRTRAFLLAATISVSGWIAGPCHGQHDAVTKAHHDIDMSFDVAGRVKQIAKMQGDYVKVGEVLVVLDNTYGAAEVERLRLLAENDVSVRAAQAQLELDQVNRDIIEKLVKTGAATELELKRADVQVKIRGLELEQAQLNLKNNQAELEKAIAQHDRYTLLAKGEGYIEKVAGQEVAEGESVQALQPVIRIVKTDKLIVDAFVPTSETLSLKVGDQAWIRADQPEHDQPVAGTIKHIAKVADPASNTKRVRIRVPNEKEYLEAGWHVMVYLSRPVPLAAAGAE